MSDVETARSSRLEVRRKRRRRRRRVVGVLVVVLALLAAAFAIYLAQDDQTAPPPAAEPVRTQTTLLMQVQGENGEALASALLARDPEQDTGAALLIPPQVLVTVPGKGSLSFGRALSSVPPQGSRDALSDLVGVTVDHGWVITTTLLAQLIDALGGVPVEVDVPVVRGQQVLVNTGAQNLDGARAVEFLRFLAPEEQEQARLARLQEVLDGLINVLPREQAELTAQLEVLGGRSVTTMELPALSELLLGLAAADEAGQMQYDSLPVIPIDPGGGVTAFRVDPPKLQTVVDRLLADSVPAGVREGGNRVLVLNGVGTPGLGEQVRTKLVAGDFVFVDSRNAPSFGYKTSQVFVSEATAEAQALGKRVAEAIGVPGAQVVTQDFGTVADVVVIVGEDFKPSLGRTLDVRIRTTREEPVPASPRAVELGLAAAQAAADKLASDILLLDVSEQLVITDVFLLASAPNDRQVKAVVDEIEDRLRELGAKPVRREGTQEARWVLLDFVDIVVHVQHEEERIFYALERLWKDCPTIPFVDADVSRAAERKTS